MDPRLTDKEVSEILGAWLAPPPRPTDKEVSKVPGARPVPPPRLPLPFDDYDETDDPSRRPRTLAEQRVCALLGALRAKSGWAEKRPLLATKWRSELLAQGFRADEVDYALAELEWAAARRVPLHDLAGCAGTVWLEPAGVDGVWQADGLAGGLARELLAGACELEAGPADWHPGSAGLVRDLVHPSMHCLVYGKTLAVAGRAPDPSRPSDAGGGVPTEPPRAARRWQDRGAVALRPVEAPKARPGENPAFLSRQSAWLPAEFEVGGDGRARALSPVNGLHPGDTGLYAALATAVGRFVPLFEKVLADLAGARRVRQSVAEWYPDEPTLGDLASALGGWKALRRELRRCWDETEDDEGGRAEEAWAGLEAAPRLTFAAALKRHGAALGDDLEDRLSDLWYEKRRPQLPPFEAFAPTAEPPAYSLRGRRLQLIVKMANIELTPEHPRYAGGSWHVEGMLNERIVATGLCYYSNDNVRPPELHFREAVCAPAYEQNDTGVEQVYGLKDDEPLVQGLGSVVTAPGRCLAFPNVYQHRVGDCELEDPSRPGRRRILALFLVDPGERIPSTLFVPAQQPDWYFWRLRGRRPFADLAPEVAALIAVYIRAPPGPWSWAEACAHRAALVEERGAHTRKVTRKQFERKFSLCEH